MMAVEASGEEVMVHVHHTGTAAVPHTFAWDYISDFRNAEDWLFGITKLDVVGDIPFGPGAVYEGGMKLGPKTLGAVFNVETWEPPSLLTFGYVSGFEVRSKWQLKALGEEEFELEVDVHYELPGGIAGRALGKIIEPFVILAVRHSDTTLRKKLEHRYADSPSR
ncbi:SRPBCC family protein [Antrihabitans stalactiti]|nr:SRPBCC family protein [Antrihabitans stalactiti]